MSATETARPDGPPGAWLDEGEVSPDWAPPPGDPVRRPRVSGSLIYGGAMLGLVLVIAVVWGVGGFRPRTDLLRPVEPGVLISTGPFEFTFTEATAQQRSDATWQIGVIGQARTTGNETIAPNYFGERGMFVLRDPASPTTATPETAAIGGREGAIGLRSDLVPGLPPIPYRLTFPLPASYRPGPTIRFGVFDLVYVDRYLLTDEKEWRNGTYASRLELPVRVLPPKS